MSHCCYSFLSAAGGEESSEQTQNTENQQRETYVQETNERVVYKVEDGLAVFEGDIILGDPDVIDREGVPLSALYPEKICEDDDDQADGCIDGQVRETFIQGTDEVIQYRIIDGWAIYGGDIIIGKPEVLDVEGVPLSTISPDLIVDDDAPISKKAIYNNYRKWQWNGSRYLIYYRLSYNSLNYAQRALVLAAMKEIMDANPLIRFESTSNYEPSSIEEPRMPEDYIFIVASNTVHSYSWVGRRGGRQVLGLGHPGRSKKSTILHELMHALGFRHEHQRPDRDRHVVIKWANIQPKWRFAYAKFPHYRYRSLYGPYDIHSIMHYPSYTPFAIDSSKPTIVRLPDYLPQMGGGNLSDNDKNALRRMYEMPPRKPQQEEDEYNG